MCCQFFTKAWWTDGWMDRRMNRPSYRDAMSRLKTVHELMSAKCMKVMPQTTIRTHSRRIWILYIYWPETHEKHVTKDGDFTIQKGTSTLQIVRSPKKSCKKVIDGRRSPGSNRRPKKVINHERPNHSPFASNSKTGRRHPPFHMPENSCRKKP